MATEKKSVFETLSAINVNGHTEDKNGLTYLSWAWAWAELKKNYPEATFTVYENDNGFNYFTDGRTCWVKTGVTVEGIELIEYLPVMDFKNKSIPYENVTSVDVNKAIQRSLTKAVARHGLGLYIYAGEDIPDTGERSETPTPKKTPKKSAPRKEETTPAVLICERCGKPIAPVGDFSSSDVAEQTRTKFGRQMCFPCGKETKAENEKAAKKEVPVEDLGALPFPIED